MSYSKKHKHLTKDDCAKLGVDYYAVQRACREEDTGLIGLCADGTVYTIDSPAVVEYKKGLGRWDSDSWCIRKVVTQHDRRVLVSVS